MTFLLPKYGWQASGGFSVVYTYASLLARAGHEVRVLHPRRLPPGGWPAPVGVMGRARRAAARLRDHIMRPRLRWAVVDPRVELAYIPEISARHVPDGDAVIATWWSTAEAALELPASKGRRFHLVQGYEVWNGAEERVHAAWRAPLHKIFIAGWLQRRALELGVPESMTTFIPNAVPHDTFFVTRPIDARPPRVAMLYSSQPYKGGDVGLDILRRAKERVPALSAALFGVERAPHGLPSWITYTRNASARELAANIYNEAAIYLCPSLSEGWHLPPAEAMACGCALVSSDIGGVQDYAVHHDTALLFPAGDVEAGAACVARLLADGEERMRLAARGRDRISTFSWDRSAARLEALLARSIETADGGPQ
ncbi:MAG TPA: glycosyltransferase family 4 protein [Longimicrobiales bacterium]|nr:glycosyltransferase family 4 protein [Longimicrobiales bacterium]